jgi:uncharacterized membrane protein YphA (DoxX/SURF4 family)
MFYDATPLETIGRLLIVGFFLVAGLCNLTKAQIKNHIVRLAEKGIPFPAGAYWFALALQFTGCALILANWYASIGVWCLIVFTVIATAIFLRFWTIEDPMRRNITRIMLLDNTAILGGLFLLLQNVK